MRLAEPPPNFNAWCAIGAISALLGKKCFIPQGHFTTFPNLYIVLVGPPATRKSTAMNVLKKMLRGVAKVPLAPESATRESLIDDMARARVEWNLLGKDISYWQATAFVTELEQFIGGKHINDAMVKFLTAIWDEPFFKERTRKGGEVTIHNPYFTMLACCTSSWINEKLQADVISDGFTRRTIFVNEQDLNCLNPWPEDGPREEELNGLMLKDALRIFNIAGKFHFTPEARAYYDALYMNQRKMAEDHIPQLEHYFSSRHILLQKVVMCLSAAHRSDRIVDSSTLRLANDFLLETEKSLDRLFAGVGRNELAPIAARITDILAEQGSLTEMGIFSKLTYASASFNEFRELLDTLVACGDVRRLEFGSGSSPSGGLLEYELSKERPKRIVVNLLEKASRLKVSSEKLPEGTELSGTPPDLAPATEQLLQNQAQKKADHAQGVLLRGKSPEPPETLATLLAKLDERKAPETEQVVQKSSQPSLPGLAPEPT